MRYTGVVLGESTCEQGRARHKHGGQTASVFLSDSLGGRQIGTLAHITTWKHGPLVLDAIPDQTAQSIVPLLERTVPRTAPLFTDEGYRFLNRIYPQHRMIAHSARSKDNRYRWARNRWSRNGIHNQCAEGHGRSIKLAMRGYSYFRPENAPLYLGEHAFWRSVKYYGLTAIAEISRSRLPTTDDRRSSLNPGCADSDQEIHLTR